MGDQFADRVDGTGSANDCSRAKCMKQDLTAETRGAASIYVSVCVFDGDLAGGPRFVRRCTIDDLTLGV